ncbi:hypothetical protein QOT17_005237 [Balamuthia mandrillaris]
MSSTRSQTYVRSDGTVGPRSSWSLSAVPDLFWGIVNGITLFVQTMISPEATQEYLARHGRTEHQPPSRGRITGVQRPEVHQVPMAGG